MPVDILVLGAASAAAAGGAAACAQRVRCSREGDGFSALTDGASKTPSRFQVARDFLAAKLGSHDEPAKNTPDPWVQRPTSPTSGTPWEYQCRIDVCLHDYGEICGISMLRRQADDARVPSVCHVIPGSSAARAGVKEGDWLVSVDSAPLPENAQGPELVSIVAGAGRPVYLSFARPAGRGGLLDGAGIDGTKIRSGEHIVL